MNADERREAAIERVLQTHDWITTTQAEAVLDASGLLDDTVLADLELTAALDLLRFYDRTSSLDARMRRAMAAQRRAFLARVDSGG